MRSRFFSLWLCSTSFSLAPQEGRQLWGSLGFARDARDLKPGPQGTRSMLTR